MIGASARRGGRAATRLLLAAGVVAPILFVVGFTVAGALRPGYSAVRDVISDLGAGPGAWLQNANFALTGLLLVAFAFGFRRAMRPVLTGGRLTTCFVLLAVSGLGFLGAAYFSAPGPDAAPDAQMREGLLHLAAFLTIFLPLIAGQLVVGWWLRRTPGWRGYGWYSLATGAVALALVAAFFVVANPDSELGIAGVVSRALVMWALAWHAVTGWRLGRSAPEAHERGETRLDVRRAA